MHLSCKEDAVSSNLTVGSDEFKNCSTGVSVSVPRLHRGGLSSTLRSSIMEVRTYWACQALLKSVGPKGLGGSSPSASVIHRWFKG